MTEDTRFISTDVGFFNIVKLSSIIYQNKHRGNGLNPKFQQYGISHPATLNSKGIQEEFYDENGIKEALGAQNLKEYCEIVQTKSCNMPLK